MKRLVASFARNHVFANILLAAFIVAGIIASVLMVRELFPEFNLEMITVNVPYPGADPEEVEEGISRRIEEAVDGLEGIKQYTTFSKEGRATAMVEIYEGYDVGKAKDDIENRINAAAQNFPEDAERPIITQFTFTREVIVLALSGPLDERGLKEWAERIKDELTGLNGVSQVAISGAREYEISIEVSEERLREFGLTFSQVADAVRRSNLNMAGGTLRTEGEEIRLRTVGRKYWGDEFRDIVVLARPTGDIVRLDQVAEVRDTFVEGELHSRLNGQPALLVIVSKTSEEDAIDIAAKVRGFVADKKEQLPPGLNISIINDQSKLIEARIDLLVRNGAIGLTLVFLLLWLFLDLRLSFWAAMGIPISLSGGLALLWLTGGTINMISLFGLIMVLGIVVDDAIIVGESIYYHRKKGDPQLTASVNGTMEVGMPVVAAVITTVVAFLPLMFVGGIMGKFISILPVAVISALLVSLVECLIMLPAHLSALPDPNDAERIRRQQRNPLRRVRRSISEGLEYFVHHIYMPFLAKALTYRYAVIAIALMVLMLTVGLFRGGIVQYVMFPDIDGNTMTATIEFPNGTPIERTGRAVERMERAVEELAEQTPTESGEPLVEHMYSLVGGSLAENPSGELLTGGLPHTGSVRVELLESADRGVHSKVLMDRWQEIIGKAPGAVSLSIEGMEGGPPGKPIEIWIQGQNMDQILLAADQAVKRLQKFEGVSQIQSDFRPGKNEIRFALKPEARTMGLTVADLARQLNAGFFGEEAMRLQRGRDDIRVRVRYPEAERKRLSDLENVRIRTPQGHELPLSAVADLKYGPGYAGITRTDGMRRVAVTADVNTEIANTEEIVNTLAYGHPQGARFAEGPSFFDELRQQYPGIRVALEGEKRDSAESLGSLMVGFPLALIGIFVIIATMFRSYLQPLIIMVTVPFGMIGAVLGHVIMGMDVTLISMFGIVALAGVVVNDAIVLIECVNEYTANKIPFFEALARAGARRFRAILLTTLSTVGGLAPMILETDLQAQFLKPMAVSIAAGVAFATLLTLLLVPCLLGILNDFRRVARRLTTGEWPDANDVEPARHRADDSAELAILPETSTYIPENTEEAPGRPAAAGFSGNGNGRRSRRGAEAEGVPAGGGRRRTAAGSSARGTGSRRAASAARDEALSAGRTGNGANNRR